MEESHFLRSFAAKREKAGTNPAYQAFSIPARLFLYRRYKVYQVATLMGR
jgi:hypothetical protein